MAAAIRGKAERLGRAPGAREAPAGLFVAATRAFGTWVKALRAWAAIPRGG
ncbi:MAG: hypothetical protein QJR08_00320 [Bacillota bacterium]|nr:hypothetical protein [Bacillota bacterium]